MAYQEVLGAGDPGGPDSPNSGRQKWNENDEELYGRFNTFSAASEAAMLALAAKKGDVAVRTDATPDAAYRLSAEPATVLANWVQISGFGGGGGAPDAHAASHTNGTDDIQSATAAQKGLATAAQITKLDGIESGATADQTRAEIVGLWTGTPDGTKYLRDDGTLAAPAGGGAGEFTVVSLGSDISTTSLTNSDVTGLSFAITAGTIYFFEADIVFDAAASTTGSKWGVSGPASPTRLFYKMEITSGPSGIVAAYASTYDPGVGVPSPSSVPAGSYCYMRGFIQPSSSGTLVVRFASEVSGSAITAKVGSILRYRAAA